MRVACSAAQEQKNLVGSLWFSPAPILGARGPQALVFLALDERTRAEGLVLAGGGLGNRLCVCPSAGRLLGFPLPLSPLLCAPGKGRWTHADTC